MNDNQSYLREEIRRISQNLKWVNGHYRLSIALAINMGS